MLGILEQCRFGPAGVIRAGLLFLQLYAIFFGGQYSLAAMEEVLGFRLAHFHQ